MVTEKFRLSNGAWLAYYGPTDSTAVPPNKVPPVAKFTFTQGTGADSYRLNVDASGSTDSDGTIVKYNVDFGNGVNVDKTTPDFLGFYYTQPGGYVVKLTVTDDAGLTNSTTQNVSVSAPVTNQAPVANFVYSQNAGTTDLSVNGTSSSDPDGDALTYAWNYGDGSTATSATPAQHHYAAAGTYNVTLTVTDSKGATNAKTVAVTIAPITSNPGGGGGTQTGGDNGINQTGVAGRQQTGSGIVAYNASAAGDFSAKVNSVGASNICSLPAGTFTFNNFSIDGGGTEPTRFWFGARITARGIYGAGSASTVIQMNPNTSDKSNDIPAQGTYQSNQLQYIIMFRQSNCVVDGVHIKGTTQGHLYNGLRFDGNTNVTLTNSKISNIPGNAGSPPGETFGVNFQNTAGTLIVKNVTGDGGGVSAAMLGSNGNTAKATVTNLYTFNHPYSAGWASWQQKGNMDFYNFKCLGARAFNAERIVGVANFYDPIFGDPKSQDFNPTYEPGWVGGSINVYFSTQQAWNNFLAARTNRKYIYCVTNASSRNLGVTKDTVKVFVNGVRQSGTNYIQWNF